MKSDIQDIKQLLTKLVEKDESNTYTVVSSSDNLTQVTTKINTISKDVG